MNQQMQPDTAPYQEPQSRTDDRQRKGRKGVAAINTKLGRIRDSTSPYSPTFGGATGGSVPPVASPFSPVDGPDFSQSQLPIFSPTSPIVYQPLPMPGSTMSGASGIDECINEYIALHHHQHHQQQQHSPQISTPTLITSPPIDHNLHHQHAHHHQQQQQMYHVQPTRYIVQHPQHPHPAGLPTGAASYNHHLELFVCPEPGCGKTFLKQYNLNSHARVHSTEKPHKCQSCPLAFKRKHDLVRHCKLVHKQCHLCNETFKTTPDLTGHLIDAHHYPYLTADARKAANTARSKSSPPAGETAKESTA
ncbi:MAG: hypothetical protein SGCHY_003806 [Lobulomycetales sp.]